MIIQSVFDSAFAPYGKVITGYDVTPLIEKLEKTTPKPTEGTVYVPSDPGLESLPLFEQLQQNVYGGMPIQIGYCNGVNQILNCLEYHRDSEVDIIADDVILLLAKQHEILNGRISTERVEAFAAPKGTIVEVFATTLHYAPCNRNEGGYRVAIVLPRGTNTDKPEITPVNEEDKLLWGKNKWLIAHPDSDEAKQGAYDGLLGENIDLKKFL